MGMDEVANKRPRTTLRRDGGIVPKKFTIKFTLHENK